MNDYLKRLYGERNKRVIRPAIMGGGGFLQISDSTYIDSNADADHSAADPIYASNSYSGSRLQKIALKFSRTIKARGVALLACLFDAESGVSLLQDTSGPEIEVYGYPTVYPITNWNGLTTSSLRYSNHGTMTLGTAVAAVVVAQAYLSQQIQAGTTQYIASGSRNSRADQVPLRHGGIVLNYGATAIQHDGLLIDFNLSWNNVFMSGDIDGGIIMDKPGSSLPADCALVFTG